MEDELSKYIKEAQSKDIKPDEIKKNLIAAGWDPAVINKLELVEKIDPTKTIFNSGSVDNSKPISNNSTPIAEPLPKQTPQQPSPLLTTPADTLRPLTNVKTDSIIPFTPTPWYKKTKIIILSLVGLFIILFLAFSICAYLYYGLGKTILGHNFFDQKWQQFVSSANGELAERDFNIEYQDKGQFKFVPSKTIKDINLKKVSEWYTPEELAFYDKLISFSWTDPGLKLNLHEFFNTNDTSKPKIDGGFKLNFTDEGSTYSIEDLFKLIDLNAYDSLYLNDTLRSYIKDKINIITTKYPEYKKDGEIAIKKLDEWNSKWFRYELDKDTVKYIGERLNNSSNWQFIGSVDQRDYQRKSYAEQIAERAVEYYQKNNKWPNQLSDLKDINSAPTPTDGRCTDEGNKFSLLKQGEKLLVTYCLGQDDPYYKYDDTSTDKNKAGMNAIVVNKPTDNNSYNSYYNNINSEAYTCPKERKCLLDKDQPQANPFKDILKNNRPFDVQSFHGMSKIDNEWTVHYTLKINKDKLRNIFISVAKQNIGNDEYNKNDDYAKKRREYFEKRLDWWLNNQNITNFEVWLGVKNGRLFKVTWDQNIPSAVTTANWAYKSLTSGALKQDSFGTEIAFEKFTPDQRRLLDIGNMYQQVSSYKSYYGGYPPSKQGQIDGGKYNSYPINSITPPDGKCTDFYNTYWYSTQGNPSTKKSNYYYTDDKTIYPEFSITFCLGFKTSLTKDLIDFSWNSPWVASLGLKEDSTLQPGIYKITSQGISLFSCPPDKTCYKTVSTPEQTPPKQEGEDFSKLSRDELNAQIEKEYLALPWNATLHVSYTANNFGKDKNIETPKDSKTWEEAQQEIENEVNGQTDNSGSSGSLSNARSRARDARRVADIAQMRTALELYLNDKGDYPKDLKTLSPEYINPVPTAPTPVDGQCTETQNTYTYTYLTSGSYKLTFCLGSDAGAYKAGPRTLTQYGIQ